MAIDPQILTRTHPLESAMIIGRKGIHRPRANFMVKGYDLATVPSRVATTRFGFKS